MGQINLIFDVNGVIKDHMHAWDEFNMREFNLYGFSQIYYSCIYAFGERERESFYELLKKSKFKDSSWILRINEILVLFSRWFITIYKTSFQTKGFYRTYADTEY